MQQGIVFFNRQRYWECHEVLEDAWLEARGDPARYVYWAVIQVACCLLHWRDGNLTGAAGMLKKAKDKLSQWEKEEAVNFLLEHNLDWTRFRREVFSIKMGAGLEEYRNLYAFRFKDPVLWEYHI